MLSYKPLHQSARHPRNSTVMVSYKPLHQSARHPRNSTVMLSYKPLHQSQLSFTERCSKCHSNVFRLTSSFYLPRDIFVMTLSVRNTVQRLTASPHRFLRSINPTLQQQVMQLTPFHLTLLQFHLISQNELRGL
jgi:hypothetical protein